MLRIQNKGSRAAMNQLILRNQLGEELLRIPETLIPLTLWESPTTTLRTKTTISDYQPFPQRVTIDLINNKRVKTLAGPKALSTTPVALRPCGCGWVGGGFDGFACGNCRALMLQVAAKEMDWLQKNYGNGFIV